MSQSKIPQMRRTEPAAYLKAAKGNLSKTTAIRDKKSYIILGFSPETIIEKGRNSRIFKEIVSLGKLTASALFEIIWHEKAGIRIGLPGKLQKANFNGLRGFILQIYKKAPFLIKVTDKKKGIIGINNAILQIASKDFRRILFQVGISHSLRELTSNHTPAELIKEDLDANFNLLKQLSLKTQQDFHSLIDKYIAQIKTILSPDALFLKKIVNKRRKLEPWQYDTVYESLQHYPDVHGKLFFCPTTNEKYLFEFLNENIEMGEVLLKSAFAIDFKLNLNKSNQLAVIGFGKNYLELLAIAQRYPKIKGILGMEIFKEFVDSAKQKINNKSHLKKIGIESSLINKIKVICTNAEDLKSIDSSSYAAIFTFGLLDKSILESGGWTPDAFTELVNPDWENKLVYGKINNILGEIHRILGKQGVLFSFNQHSQRELIPYIPLQFEYAFNEDKDIMVAVKR